MFTNHNNNITVESFQHSFKNGIAYDAIIHVKCLFIAGDKFVFLAKGGEGVENVQVPSGRQLQCAVARSGARNVNVVLIIRCLGMRLSLLRSP